MSAGGSRALPFWDIERGRKSDKGNKMTRLWVVIFFACSLARAEVLLTDPFDGTAVDPTRWLMNTSVPGSSVTLVDGSLNLLNRGIITTVGDFASPFRIEGRFKFLNNETSNFYIWLRSTGFGQPGIGVKFEMQAEPWNPELRQIAISDQTGTPDTWLEYTLILNHSTRLISLDTWYNFKVFDSGSEISVYFNDSNDPTLTLATTGSAGSKIAFFNREGAAGGSSISEGGVTRFDSITISVPEPSALSLLAVGLGGLAMMRRRRSKKAVLNQSPTKPVAPDSRS